MFLNPFGLQLVTANGINETFSSWTLWKVQKDREEAVAVHPQLSFLDNIERKE